jgi:hypothetical protein
VGRVAVWAELGMGSGPGCGRNMGWAGVWGELTSCLRCGGKMGWVSVWGELSSCPGCGGS